MPTKQDGSINWEKLFMGFAVALVFVLQAVNQMQIERVKTVTEVEKDVTSLLSDRVMNARVELQGQIDVLRDDIKVMKASRMDSKRLYVPDN